MAVEVAVRAEFNKSSAKGKTRCLVVAGLFRLPPSSATVVPSAPGRGPVARGPALPLRVRFDDDSP